MKIDSDSPQVQIPPPLFLGASILISILMPFLITMPVFKGDDAWYPTLGAALIAGGIALVARVAVLFKRAKTNIAPWQPTTTLVLTGPFQFSRNPIYLGFVLIATGVAIACNNWLSFVGPVDLFLVLNFLVIPKEENYLTQKFGAAYGSFRENTRRWL